MTRPSVATPLTITALLAAPKTIARTFRVRSQAPEHARLDLELASSIDGTFFVFVRVLRALSENFSIGLRYEERTLGNVVLLRVNGDHGRHRNADGATIAKGPHVHSFRAPMREAPPRPGAEGSVGLAARLEPPRTSCGVATFCGLVALESTTKVDTSIAALYSSFAQLPLGLT